MERVCLILASTTATAILAVAVVASAAAEVVASCRPVARSGKETLEPATGSGRARGALLPAADPGSGEARP